MVTYLPLQKLLHAYIHIYIHIETYISIYRNVHIFTQTSYTYFYDVGVTQSLTLLWEFYYDLVKSKTIDNTFIKIYKLKLKHPNILNIYILYYVYK